MRRGDIYLRGPQSNFASTSGATTDVTVVTCVTQPVRKFRFQAKLARCVQFGASFSLLFTPLPDGCFEQLHFVGLSPNTQSTSRNNPFFFLSIFLSFFILLHVFFFFFFLFFCYTVIVFLDLHVTTTICNIQT